MRPKNYEYGSTGLVLKALRWLCPVDSKTQQRLTDLQWSALSSEFTRHQNIAQGLCLVGLLGYTLTMAIAFRPIFDAWDIGIALGLMVLSPLVYILVVCLFKGFRQAYSRWADFSTIKFAIPWSVQLLSLIHI